MTKRRRWYSQKLRAEVAALPPDTLGVVLAKACIEHGMSVAEVSAELKIAKMTVYSWFRGLTIVPDKHADRVNRLVKRLTR